MLIDLEGLDRFREDLLAGFQYADNSDIDEIFDYTIVSEGTVGTNVPYKLMSNGNLNITTVLDGYSADSGINYSGAEYLKNHPTEIKYINIGGNVRFVGNFNDCTALEKVVWTSTAGVRIDNEAFKGCVLLKDFSFPPSVSVISDKAFQNTGFTSVTVPDTVETFGVGIFRDCVNLSSAILGTRITELPTDTFRNCTSLTSVTMRGAVTSFGDSAFRNCSSLTSFTIPNTVRTLGVNVFADCTNLANVTLPSLITKIPSSAFLNCVNLETVTIPSGVTEIYDNAFENCAESTINIPVSVTRMYTHAFKNADYITINYAGTAEQWQNITGLNVAQIPATATINFNIS